MKQVYFLEGERVGLRPLLISDLTGPYSNWLNDPNVNVYNSHARFPVSDNAMLEFVKETYDSQHTLVLAVILKSNDKHVGNLALQKINWIDRNAEIAFLLGDSSVRGTGIMYESGDLLVKHAFKSLNLKRLYCGTSEENVAMIRLAKKLGMESEGIRKAALFNNGKYHDIHEFGIINR